MKNLITIGQFSKLTGVSIRSLRYYDELNLLKPVHINAETKYRYYDFSQFGKLQLILLCIDLGIPLKELSNVNFHDSDSTVIKSILDRGKVLAEEKLRNIQNKLSLIDNINSTINISDNNVDNIMFSQSYKKRYFAVEPFTTLLKDEEASIIFCDIYNFCCENNIPTSYNCGFLGISNNDSFDWYLFCEILDIFDYDNSFDKFISVDAGTFNCKILSNSYIDSFEDKELTPNSLLEIASNFSDNIDINSFKYIILSEEIPYGNEDLDKVKIQYLLK